MNKKYIVALELSGSQVKGALASVGSSTNSHIAIPTIETIITEDNADCVQYGRVQNLINATKYTKSVLERIQEEPELQDGKINGVYVALEGRSLGSEHVSAEIPLPTEMEITNNILHDLFVEASKKASPDKCVLKVLPRKYVVDSQAMPNPVGALGRRLRGDFTLVTCNPTNKRNLDLLFNDKDRVNVPVKSYIIAPLALADLVLDEEEKQLGCVLVDIGYQTTTISIYKERALQYLSTLPMGSYNITRDISAGLNLTLEKAEIAKCTHGDAQGNTRGNDDVSRLNCYVTARASEIIANINANIGYANYKPNELTGGFILAGRGAKLRNFDNLLANQTKMRVRQAQLPANINFDLNNRSVNPEDYLPLIGVIMRVSRLHEFDSCVTFKAPQPAPQPAQVQTKPVTQPTIPVSDVPKREIDEDNLLNDDKAPAKVNNNSQTDDIKSERSTKSRSSLLGKLKDKFSKLMSDPGVDDADLDN